MHSPDFDKPNGVVILTRTWKGSYFVLGNTDDNLGKRERTADMPLDQFNQVEGWQFMGGKIEAGESPEGAAIREAREEGKIKLRSQQLREADYGLPVEQEGRGYFGVQVFEAELDFWQELQLRLFRHGREIAEHHLDELSLRTRDRAVMALDRATRTQSNQLQYSL